MTTSAIPAALERIEAELLGPGGPFEMEDANVLGVTMQVFRHRPRSLRDVVVASARFGEAECHVFTDGAYELRLTFAEHSRRVTSAAAVFANRYGVGPGDRVAILAANRSEWLISFFAAVSIG